jgi:hypothetical protein
LNSTCRCELHNSGGHSFPHTLTSFGSTRWYDRLVAEVIPMRLVLAFHRGDGALMGTIICELARYIHSDKMSRSARGMKFE